MNTTNFYPVFEADQVLTNKHLNDMFNYLEQHDRLSRIKLIGSGIVCGLNVSVQPNVSITITKGCGLTSQGYLITYCDTTFTHFINYNTRNFPEDLLFIRQCEDDTINPKPFYKDEFKDGIFELLSTFGFDNLDADEQETAVALSNNSTVDLNKYVVVLFLEAEEEALKNCDTNDCNDKGSRMDFELKALLVEKEILDKITQEQQTAVPVGHPSVSPNLHHVELRRFGVPYFPGNQDLNSADKIIQAFANLVDDAKLKSIAEVLNYCFVHYYYLLENEPSNPFENVWERFKQLRDDILKNNPILIQYFYDFIDDVLKAYYEFKAKVFDVSSACCGNEMGFPLHLMLGEAAVSTASQGRSNYRQYFLYSPLFNHQHDSLAEVRLLFTRIKLLISEVDFISLTDFEKRLVKITPGRYGYVALSDRCIPYHYKVTDAGKELYRWWSYEKTRRGNERFNLGYNAFQYCAADNVVHPLLYDIERFDFFRIEGHIGKNITTALTLIKTIQQQNNLPVDVIALSADYIGALVRGEEPECVVQDLESDYRMLIAEFICKIHDAFCLVAKLPFTLPDVILRFTAATLSEATPEEASAIKSTLTFNPAVLEKLEHPFPSSLVSEFQAIKRYTKGDTLLRLCNPPANTIGSAYIQMKGRFSNPVSINTSQPVTLVQSHAFEFIDAVESVLELVMNFELADVNSNELKSRYNRFENEVRILSLFAISLLKQLEDADKSHLNDLASDLYLDLMVFNLEMLLHLCFVEQIEALKSEYLRRMAQYRLEKNFSYHFRNCSGMEHKAGTPRGGTFVVVYHEERGNRLIDKNSLFTGALSNLLLANFREIIKPDVPLDKLTYQTKLLQKAILYQHPEFYMRFREVLTKHLDNCKDMPDDVRTELTGIINEEPKDPHFELADGMVIADFYIPYICCSDCPPVAYILPSIQMIVEADDPVCDEEGKNYTVRLNVTGGSSPYSFFINNVQQPDNNIKLASGNPDTKVTVKDSSGQTAEIVIKSFTCSTPCDLPCNGAAESCFYALWIAKPDGDDKIRHEVKNATLTLTNENGVPTSVPVITIFQDVFNGQDNTITQANFDSAFNKLVEKLNSVVPAEFVTEGRPMFGYEGDKTQLLIIEKFTCHKISLRIEMSNVTIKDHPFVLIITYNETDGTTIEDLRRQLVTKVVKFNCSSIDKCNNNSIEKSCNEQLSITKVNSDIVLEGNARSYKFTTLETFDSYFWYFEDGTPLFSDKPESDLIVFANRDNSNLVLVKVIGIKKDTGCFAIFKGLVPVQ